MKAIIADDVICPLCSRLMNSAMRDVPVEEWQVYCSVPYCPNYGRHFKQPIREVELEEV